MKFLILFLACQILGDNFADTLDKAVEARQKITSFECDFTIGKSSDQKANTEELYLLRKKTKSVGSLAYDSLTGVLVARQSDELISAEGEPKSFVDTYVNEFDDREKVTAVLDGVKQTWDWARLDMIRDRDPFDVTPSALPFYVTAFGLGGRHEHSTARPLDLIADDLKKIYGQAMADTTPDGQLWFDMITYQIAIDPKRDYWPTTAARWSMVMKKVEGAKPKVDYALIDKWTIDLVSVDNVWMPKRVQYQLPTETTTFEFDWKSVNKTIDPDSINLLDISDNIKEKQLTKEQESRKNSSPNPKK